MSIYILRSGIIVVDEESMPAFKELVQRGANLWPDASPEIKKFADELIEGKPQQDYDQLEYYKVNPAKRYRHYHQCSCGYVSIISTISIEPPDYPITCHNEHITVQLLNEEGQPYEKVVPCKRTEVYKQPVPSHLLKSGE